MAVSSLSLATAVCPVCELVLPRADFGRDASKASGYASRCKACDRARAKRYYEANRERKRAYYQGRYRERFAAGLIPVRMCERCGEVPAMSQRHPFCEPCRLAARYEAGKRHLRRLTEYGFKVRSFLCQECSTGFVSRSPSAKYCSDTCRSVANSRKRELAGRPGPEERGYGRAHRKLRQAWAAQVAAGLVDCARCGERINPNEPWDLGHDDHDRTAYSGPEHRRCNRATSSRIRPRRSRAW